MITERYVATLVAIRIPEEEHTLEYFNSLLPPTLLWKGVELHLLVENSVDPQHGRLRYSVRACYRQGGKRLFTVSSTEIEAKARLMTGLMYMGILQHPKKAQF